MVRRGRYGAILAAALAGSVCLPAVVPTVAQAAEVELTIGGLLESTGPLSELGPASEKAIKLAVDAANKAAQQAGVAASAKLVTADSQGDPQAALSAARTLVDKNAACIIGPSTTPESISVLNGLTLQKKLTLWPQASSTRLRKVSDEGTIFRTVPPDNLQSKALVEAIKRHVGTGGTVAFAFRNEPYGDALSKSFSQDWVAAGGKMGTVVSYDPQQASFDSEAGQLVADKPDAYVVIDYPETFAKFGAALVRTGAFDPKKLFLPDAMAFATVPASIPAQAIEGAYGVAGGSPTGTDAFHLFGKLWDEAGGVANTSLTSNIFDSGIVCFLAAVAAQSTEPGAIRDKVRLVTKAGAPQFTLLTLSDAVKQAATGAPIDFVGVSGLLRFSDNGDPTTSLYDVFEYIGGKQTTIEQVDVK